MLGLLMVVGGVAYAATEYQNVKKGQETKTTTLIKLVKSSKDKK